jgi:basic membrane protein A
MEEAKTNGAVDQTDYIESVDTRDYEKNIAYFAEKGYDIIVTTGIGLRDETLRAADLYPDSIFVGMNQPEEEKRPNLVSITFSEDQIGFAAGATAARISETRIIGAVCETSEIDSMWKTCEGFRAGAKYVDEKITVQVIYHENADSEKLFLDNAWGYDTAQKLISRGVDVIFAVGGVTGQGALEAAADAKVNAIGAEKDQDAALGESSSSVLTSIFGDASFEVQSVMRLLKDGNANLQPASQIKFVPFGGNFPESYTNELNTLLLELSTGKIKTKVPLTKP